MSDTERNAYDVVVVGGGAAGLSGAIALARSRRRVLVLDDGTPRNAPAHGVHNVLGHEGTPPGELLARGRADLLGYGGEVRPIRATAIRRDGDRFVVDTEGGVVTGRRVLVTTGVRDVLPDVPGLAERWGIDVLHCPYCHGWEVRDQRIGILATSPVAMHQTLLFRQLSPHLTYLQHTAAEPTADEREQLAALGVPVVRGTVTEVVADRTGLVGVRVDGSTVVLDALVVATRGVSRTQLLAELDLQPAEVRMGETLVGEQVEADVTGSTSVPGLYVAGNVSAVNAQVMSSAAAGTMAGAAINMDLIKQDVAVATAVARASRLTELIPGGR